MVVRLVSWLGVGGGLEAASGLVCGDPVAGAGVVSEEGVTWPDIEAVAVEGAEVLGSVRLGWNGV